jgi:hypothetical protein
MCLPVSRLFWVSSLAYPNLLGTKSYVDVDVDVDDDPQIEHSSSDPLHSPLQSVFWSAVPWYVLFTSIHSSHYRQERFWIELCCTFKKKKHTKHTLHQCPLLSMVEYIYIHKRPKSLTKLHLILLVQFIPA